MSDIDHEAISFKKGHAPFVVSTCFGVSLTNHQIPRANGQVVDIVEDGNLTMDCLAVRPLRVLISERKECYKRHDRGRATMRRH